MFALGVTTVVAGSALAQSRFVQGEAKVAPASETYQQLQRRLARGWNTWDVNSVTTQVLLPEGLAIHVGMKHNATENGDAWLGDALIGRLDEGSEAVTPGAHAWDGSYTDVSVEWKGHRWRVESAHAGEDGDGLVMLVTPLKNEKSDALPPTVVISVGNLWNRALEIVPRQSAIAWASAWADMPKPHVIYCTCRPEGTKSDLPVVNAPVLGPYFAADLTGPIGISTEKRRTLDEIRAAIAKQKGAYEEGIKAAGANGPILDAIETTLGWDTIFEPEKERVVSPVSRVWSVHWGGYVVFDWDTFFAASMAGIGDKDLAYADAIEVLREETPQGFVPNYARAGGWKSFDRSEPPVGAITVLGLYKQFTIAGFLKRRSSRC